MWLTLIRAIWGVIDILRAMWSVFAAGSGSTKTLTGTQGREIKTKSLKKKGHKSRDDLGSDEEVTTSKPKSRSQEIEFMTLEEIEGVLRKEESLKECPEELVAEIAQQLLRLV